MKPQKVNATERVFGGDIKRLLPAWDTIPDEFKVFNHPWVDEVERIFFSGGSIAHWKEKPGINRFDAISHFMAVVRSWEPKHEHKTAGCAYLLSQWFELGVKEEVKQ